MKVRSQSVITAILLATAVIFLPSIGHASTVWKTGDKVGTPNLWDEDFFGPVYSFPANGYPCTSGGSPDATVFVKQYGDYIWVLDPCKDGKSAVARVNWSHDGVYEARVCRNPHGKGSWARCDFNWPENKLKYVTAGVYNGNTGYLKWYTGTITTFNDGSDAPDPF